MGWRGGNKSTDLCQNIVVVITAAASGGRKSVEGGGENRRIIRSIFTANCGEFGFVDGKAE